ncbi:N-glycosidase [Lachnellula suecica]|uniref:N-glycosidase n=1 Tax=Lachnellula suecica TaxID=602035 RepID=A0A8T9C956_9HELO|nr:N-glycosidase [Lachnellula suecica]
MSDQGPLFFFKDDDRLTGWLCQWYWAPFEAEVDGQVLEFKHAEQYMMYRKALTFSDYATAKEIMLNTSPRTCKALGRATQGFDEKVWDKCKLQVVEEGSYLKFTQGVGEEAEELRQNLLATGKRELVEASPFDRVWGIGFSQDQCKKGNKWIAGRDKWGQNLLGKALGAARERIREEEEARMANARAVQAET